MIRQFPLELMYPFSKDFLREEAQKQNLTEEETKALIARFSCQDGKVTLPDEETVIEKILFISDKKLHAHFTSIYKKFGLIGTRPGKFQELYRLLKYRYEQQGLSPRILQMPPLPGHFVERPQHQQAVQDLLLCQDPDTPGTLVVSAIYGLGGIGKSVLAAALAHNPAIHARFPDGILWVTLGQNPDILPLLSGWVQALRDYHFKPISIEATTTHLRTLLYDKQVLLVVDDVWNSEHLEPFRVGRGQSRVLVTTRSAQIMDAQRYDLDVMTPQEALAMLTNQLGKELSSSEQEQALSFAKEVGYLPLALELAAAQVKHGATWEVLLQEFQQEVVRLGTLDLLSAEELVEEATSRKYSLIACFNLSLRQLVPEQLQQFAWLGVLPDDVAISREVVSVLWQVVEPQAGAVLRELRSKALLLNDVTRGDRRTYRMHDLLHDLAMKLLVAPAAPESEVDLPGLGLELAQAHHQFLECYCTQKTNDGEQWHTLKADGYIHRHLTWHMVQAQQSDAVHQLLQETTEQGRNGWFEACDALGETAIFVRDVGRGWKLAEALEEEQLPEALILLWRYALIRASLNSLANNVPPELIGALVAKRVWQPAQGLAYVKLAQEPEKQAEGIKQLAPYLPEALLPEALNTIHELCLETDHHVSVLSSLAPRLPELWPMTLETAQLLQEDTQRINILSTLAPHLPKEFWPEVLEMAYQIDSKYSQYHDGQRIEALGALAPHLPKTLLGDALKMTLKIKHKEHREANFHALALYLPDTLLTEALDIVFRIKDCHTLKFLAPYLPETLLKETLEVAQYRLSEDNLIDAICALAPYLSEVLLSRALEIGLKEVEIIREDVLANEDDFGDFKNFRDHTLYALASNLRNFPTKFWPEILEWTRHMIDLNGEESYFLGELAPHLPTEFWPEILERIRQNQSMYELVDILGVLAPYWPEPLLREVLEITRQIQNIALRVGALLALTPRLPSLGREVLETSRQSRDFEYQLEVLYKIAPHCPQLWPKALEVIQEIVEAKSENSPYFDILVKLSLYWPELWCKISEIAFCFFNDGDDIIVNLQSLAPHLPMRFWPKVLAMVQQLEFEGDRFAAFQALAPHLSEELLREVLGTTRQIQYESHLSKALKNLAPYLPEVLLRKALSLTCQISESERSFTLLILAHHLPEALMREALEVAKQIQDEQHCALAISYLFRYLPKAISIEALEAISHIKLEAYRASALRNLGHYLSSESLFKKALEITQQITSEANRSIILRELSPYLPEVLFKETLEITRQITSEADRIRALGGLAHHLPELWWEILEITRQITSEADRAMVLRELAPYLPEVLFKEALEITRQITSEADRIRALGGLAHYLPELWWEILEITRQITSEADRASALSKIAPHLSEVLFKEALEITRQITSETSRAMVLRELTPYLPEALFKEALEITQRITSETNRFYILCNLFLNLPKALLGRALEMAQQIRPEVNRIAALSNLARYLPETILREIFTFEATRVQTSGTYYFHQNLIPYLPAALLKEALQITHQIQSESYRAKALCKLAPHLPEALFKEALQITHQIQSKSYRANALCELAPHLPKTLLREILEITYQLRTEKLHIYVLHKLTSHLPEVLLKEAIELSKQFEDFHYRTILVGTILNQLYSLNFRDMRTVGLKTVDDWSNMLNILAHQKQQEFISSFLSLKDTILILAGKDTLIPMTRTLFEVCEQWH